MVTGTDGSDRGDVDKTGDVGDGQLELSAAFAAAEGSESDTGNDDSDGERVLVTAWGATRPAALDALRNAVDDAGLGIVLDGEWAEDYVSGDVPAADIAARDDALAVGAGDDRPDLGTIGTVDRAVVSSLSALGATHTEIADRVDDLLSSDVTVSVVSRDITLDPSDADIVRAVLVDLDAAGPELARGVDDSGPGEWRPDGPAPPGYRWEDLKWDGGRPPLGFEAVDGYLVPDGLDEVRDVLSSVIAGRRHGLDVPGAISVRQAARELGTSERSIRRAIKDRAALYGLPSASDDE